MEPPKPPIAEPDKRLLGSISMVTLAQQPCMMRSREVKADPKKPPAHSLEFPVKETSSITQKTPDSSSSTT